MHRAVVFLLAVTATARADWPRDNFAAILGINAADIKDITEYRTPVGFEVGHVLVGRWSGGVALVPLRCDEKQCRGSRVWLNPATAVVDVVGLADLAAEEPLLDRNNGRNGPLSGFIQLDYFAKPARRYQWPALLVVVRSSVVETDRSRFGGEVRGPHRRAELVVISLRAADENNPELAKIEIEDIYPTGAGQTTSLRVARGSDGAFDLVATEQREIESRSECLRPKPTVYRLVLDNHRFARQAADGFRSPGCH